MTLIPYLNMPGNAEEAMNFYKAVFGGKTEVQRWSEMPPNPKMPVSEEWQEKIMNGSLTIRDDVVVYISDSWPDGEIPKNSNVFLHLEFDSEEDLRTAFEKLAEGGKINMPVDRMFWGAVYGDLIDKYGIGWGFHYQAGE